MRYVPSTYGRWIDQAVTRTIFTFPILADRHAQPGWPSAVSSVARSPSRNRLTNSTANDARAAPPLTADWTGQLQREPQDGPGGADLL